MTSRFALIGKINLHLTCLRKQPFLLAFAAEDVSQGIISATQRQKFHTDDVKLFTNDRQKTKGHEGQM